MKNSSPILYGHPASPFTWKVQIALYAAGETADFRSVDEDHPDNAEFVKINAGPWTTAPVLVAGDDILFEATSIIEYINIKFPSHVPLIPTDQNAAVAIRMLDRVFDNQVGVPACILGQIPPYGRKVMDEKYYDEARMTLRQAYDWLEGWLMYHDYNAGIVTLIECAAAPALWLASRVEPMKGNFPRLEAWRKYLLSLEPVVASATKGLA